MASPWCLLTKNLYSSHVISSIASLNPDQKLSSFINPTNKLLSRRNAASPWCFLAQTHPFPRVSDIQLNHYCVLRIVMPSHRKDHLNTHQKRRQTELKEANNFHTPGGQQQRHCYHESTVQSRKAQWFIGWSCTTETKQTSLARDYT